MGGIISLRYLESELPSQNFLYLGDTKYLPYGSKSGEFLVKRTFECLEWMFDQGCSIVILACNTASAYAIRKRQAEFPEKKVLSVTIPGVEKIVEGGYEKTLLLATKATIQSSIYPSVVKRLFPSSSVEFLPIDGGDLVNLIEDDAPELKITQYLEKILSDVKDIDSLVLGCTHYPVIQDQIMNFLPDVPIINPSLEAAQALVKYFSIHPEYSEEKLNKIPTTYFLTGDKTYGFGETHVSIPVTKQ